MLMMKHLDAFSLIYDNKNINRVYLSNAMFKTAIKEFLYKIYT